MALANDLDAAVHGTGRIQGPEFDRLWTLLCSLATTDGALRAVELRASPTHRPLQPMQPTLLPDPAPLEVHDQGIFSAEPFGSIGTASDESAPPVPQEEDGPALSAFSLDFDMFDVEPAPDVAAAVHPTQAPSPAPFNAALDW